MDAAATVATSVRDGWVVWEVPGKPVVVRLGLDVVSRLGLAVWEGFKALPRRGLETGGLLIGDQRDSGGQVVVDIADFEAVESEHAAGPSYLLSDLDRRLLESRIAAHGMSGRKLHIVGFYRSHTRTGFGMTLEDESLFSNYFPNSSDVFLLMKSNGNAPPIGGFVIREGGKILSPTPYLEFTFSAERAVRTVPESSPILALAAPVPVVRTQPELRTVSPLPGLAASPRVIFTAAGVAILAAILAVAASFAIWRRPSIAASADRPAPLALSISDSSSGLRLSWNHTASQRATHATLWIRDGGSEHKLDLDRKQLNEGSIAYWPKTHDVDFRLQLVEPGGSITESVRSIGGPVRVAEQPAPAEVVKLQLPQVVNAPVVPRASRTRVASRQRLRAFEFTKPPVQRSSIPEPPAIDQQVRATLPASISFGGATPPVRESVSIKEPNKEPNPYLQIRVEPVQRPTRSFPLVGKRQLQSSYVPPAPLREPAIPALPGRNLEHAVNIDVKVYVNRSGKVEFSEVLTEVTPDNRDLAASAVFSARKCEFAPAHSGSETVAGEVILHYQYRPVSRTQGAR